MLEFPEQKELDMTLEELEYKEKHPNVPDSAIPGIFEDRRRAQAVKDGARRAAQLGMTTRSLPITGVFRRDAEQ